MSTNLKLIEAEEKYLLQQFRSLVFGLSKRSVPEIRRNVDGLERRLLRLKKYLASLEER